MEFIDSYVESLKGEYTFLKEYYQVFKMKHSSMPKNLVDRLFHEEVIQLIKTEQVGEDSYRLVVQTEKIDIKLPSVLDDEEDEAVPFVSSPKKPSSKTTPPPTPKPTPKPAPSYDPCGHGGPVRSSC